MRGALLRRGEVGLPEGSRFAAAPPAGGPGNSLPAEFPVPAGDDPRAFQRTGMEIRFAGGGGFGPGPAHAWLRLARPLVGGEPVPPVARVAAAADFGNGVSRVLDFRTHLFTNVDLTVTLLRDPATEWIMLDARTVAETTGIGWAASTLHDERGPIGSGQQTLFVDPR